MCGAQDECKDLSDTCTHGVCTCGTNPTCSLKVSDTCRGGKCMCGAEDDCKGLADTCTPDGCKCGTNETCTKTSSDGCLDGKCMCGGKDECKKGFACSKGACHGTQ